MLLSIHGFLPIIEPGPVWLDNSGNFLQKLLNIQDFWVIFDFNLNEEKSKGKTSWKRRKDHGPILTYLAPIRDKK